jgi:hypothetical protein
MTEISFHSGTIVSFFSVSGRYQIANYVYKARFILVHREEDSFDSLRGKTFWFVWPPTLSKREAQGEIYVET